MGYCLGLQFGLLGLGLGLLGSGLGLGVEVSVLGSGGVIEDRVSYRVMV